MIEGGRRQVGPWWASREVALEKLDAWNAEIMDGAIVAPSELTFGAHGEDWLARREKTRRVRGIAQEVARWRAHVRSAPFYDEPIQTLTRRAVADWIDALLATRAVQAFRGNDGTKRTETTRTLARGTVAQCLRLVRTALADALERELVDANVAAGVLVPKVVRDEDLDDAWTYLDEGEIGLVTWRRLLEATELERVDERRRLLFTVAIFTGMRRGELFAIRWGDVHEADRARPRIVVRRGHKGPTKSARPRDVPLLPAARAAFARLRVLATAELATDVGADDLVFPNPDGAMYGASYDAAWSDKRQRTGPKADDGTRALVVTPGAKSRAGIAREVRFHDLRHTFCSHLVMGTWGRRWTLEEVREVAGHSTIKVTERYAHLAPDGLYKAARETHGGHDAPAPAAPAIAPASSGARSNPSENQAWADPGSNRGPAPCKGEAPVSESAALRSAGAPRGAIEVARELLEVLIASDDGAAADALVDELVVAVLALAPDDVRLALAIRDGDPFAHAKALRLAELVLERGLVTAVER